jgi:hypothetical protein
MGRTVRERFAKNAPGPWYTTGQCAQCGAPQEAAPELFAPLTDENRDTYFVRQPVTPEEIERACRAAQACCVSAVRYGGIDATVVRRLGNTAEFSDYVLDGAGRLHRAGQWPEPPRRWWQVWRRATAG